MSLSLEIELKLICTKYQQTLLVNMNIDKVEVKRFTSRISVHCSILYSIG